MFSDRLRKLVTLDIVLIVVLPIVRGAIELFKYDGKVPCIAVASGVCAVWIMVKFVIIAGDTTFYDIWYMFPSRVLSGACLTVIVLIAAHYLKMDYTSVATCLFVLLLGYQDYKKDKYAYRQAIYFDIDEMSSLQELVDAHPNAFFMLAKHARQGLEVKDNG